MKDITTNVFASNDLCTIKYGISNLLLSKPMGVDYVVIGFDMEVQPLVTHNAA